MTGNENIEVGDILICHSNSGLSSVGSKVTIWGITETSINDSGSTTGWMSRKDFRWHNFSLQKCSHVPQDVIDFNTKVGLILEQNKIHIQKQRQRLCK